MNMLQPPRPQNLALSANFLASDLSWHRGLKNTGKDAEVYLPGSAPAGLIQCSVGRAGEGKTSKL